MSNNQVFAALCGVIVAFATLVKYYLDAKIDPVARQVDLLVHYMAEQK